jgi:hypothetical protein
VHFFAEAAHFFTEEAIFSAEDAGFFREEAAVPFLETLFFQEEMRFRSAKERIMVSVAFHHQWLTILTNRVPGVWPTCASDGGTTWSDWRSSAAAAGRGRGRRGRRSASAW